MPDQETPRNARKKPAPSNLCDNKACNSLTPDRCLDAKRILSPDSTAAAPSHTAHVGVFCASRRIGGSRCRSLVSCRACSETLIWSKTVAERRRERCSRAFAENWVYSLILRASSNWGNPCADRSRCGFTGWAWGRPAWR